MRSHPELIKVAEEMGLPSDGTREEIMDRILDFLGTADELQIDPMKAKDLKDSLDWGSDKPFARITKYFNQQYIMEPKLDGARMRLFIGAGSNRMNTGRRSDKSYAYIERSDNFRHLRDWDATEFAGTVLDGEVISPKASIVTASGKKTQGFLNSSVALCNTNAEDAWKTQLREGKANYFVFDILAFKGTDVTAMPYWQRREMLEKLQQVFCMEMFLVPKLESSEETITQCLTQGLEGVMIKDVDGKYQAGKRSAYWLKVKRMSTIDVFITGWLPGEGRNVGKVGALKCSVYDENGLEVEVAQPGAFTDEFRRRISQQDGSLKSEWYGTVIEVIGQEVTKNCKIRHPRMVRLRPDKGAGECSIDQLKKFLDVRS